MCPESTAKRDPSHLELLILQPTPFCNIDCDYCYLGDRLNAKKMSVAVLRRALDIILSSGLVEDTLNIVWHAGEPLAVPIDFYREAFSEVADRTAGVRVLHSMQSNGTLINDQWCSLFKEHDVHVGISIDGPPSIHDRHRKDRKGGGTHSRVMRGIETLRRNTVPFHVIAVVTADALDAPDEMFEFFLDLGATYLGFNIEELEGAHQVSTLSQSPSNSRVRRFFERIYFLAKERGDGRVRIREFDRAFAAISQGGYPDAEVALRHNQQASPLSIISVDCDGNISSFSPELLGAEGQSGEKFQFGNVLDCDLLEVLENRDFLRSLEEIKLGIRSCAEECQYFKFCGGGAPANKLFENGTFASTETMYCRHTIKTPIDILLEDLEAHLGLGGNKPVPPPPDAAERKNPQLRFSKRDKLIQISVV